MYPILADIVSDCSLHLSAGWMRRVVLGEVAVARYGKSVILTAISKTSGSDEQELF